MTMQAVLTAVILLVVTYMFFSPRFPNAVVATVGAIAVALTGTVAFKSVFTYYASTSIVLMAGMMIIGGGMFHTGFAGWMGNSIVKLTGRGERSIQIVAILAGGIMSSVCSGSASLMILYPILCSICLASNLSINRVLLPMFAGIGFGTFMTLAGSGMCSTTASILIESGYEGWEFFSPTTVGLPRAVIYFVILLFFMGRVLPDKFVKPDEAEAAKSAGLPDKLNGKMITSGLILVLTVIGMVVNSPVCPMYICAAIGAVAAVLTGCLNQKQMFASINWSTVFMIGGMTAVAKGVEASGLGAVIADS
ncbi:SLC13 family permease, partial [Enterocloster asparagiformis]